MEEVRLDSKFLSPISVNEERKTHRRWKKTGEGIFENFNESQRVKEQRKIEFLRAKVVIFSRRGQSVKRKCPISTTKIPAGTNLRKGQTTDGIIFRHLNYVLNPPFVHKYGRFVAATLPLLRRFARSIWPWKHSGCYVPCLFSSRTSIYR